MFSCISSIFTKMENGEEEDDDLNTSTHTSANTPNTIPEITTPNDIELSLWGRPTISLDLPDDDEACDDDDVDSPRRRNSTYPDGVSELFLMLTRDKHLSGRRGSTRSSTTSIDSIHLKAIAQQERNVRKKQAALL